LSHCLYIFPKGEGSDADYLLPNSVKGDDESGKADDENSPFLSFPGIKIGKEEEIGGEIDEELGESLEGGFEEGGKAS